MLSPNRVAPGRTSSPGLGNASPGQRGTVRRPTDTGRGTGWDGARQQVSALPLGTRGPRQQPRPSRTFIVVAGVVTSPCSTPPRSRK